MLRVVIVAMLLTISSQAQSGMFIDGYARWKNLNAGSKFGYVMALWDTKSSLLPQNPTEFERADRIGLNKCVEDLRLDSAMMVEAIDQAYRNDPAEWGTPPIVVFHSMLYGMCEGYINQVRKERGLKLLNLKGR